MMNRKFQRTIENFICLHCKSEVVGDGYTNHCPHCLWSQHVDVQPGDRNNSCRGAMEPIGYQPGTPHRIRHRCTKCSEEAWIRVTKNDNYETLLALGIYSRTR